MLPHLIVDAWPGEGHIDGEGGGVVVGPQESCPWGWLKAALAEDGGGEGGRETATAVEIHCTRLVGVTGRKQGEHQGVAHAGCIT